MGTNDSRIGNHRSMTIPDDVRAQPGGARMKVYVALADRCNDSGTCFPSLTKIAEDANLSRSSVCTALAWLESAGHVQRQKRRNDALWTSTIYLLPTQVRCKTPAQVVVQPTGLVVQPTGLGSPTHWTGGSPAHWTQTLPKRTLPKEHSSNASVSEKPSAPVPATPTPWEVAHAASLTVWSTASTQKLAGFSTEIVRVAKRSGADPARLVKLAGAVMSLHGVTLDTLTHPSRSALLARLDALLAMSPTDKALKERWACLSARRGWPSDIGQRLERLISQWQALDPATVPLGNAPAGSRMTSRLQNLVTTPTQDTHHTKELTA